MKVCNWLSLPLQALGCCILYLVIEAFSRHSLASAWSYMVESPWVFCTMHFDLHYFMVVYLFRRRVLVRLVMSCFWLLLGIINGVILANRVTPFTGPDLRNLSDGAKVVTKYLSKGTMILVVAALVALLALFCMGLDQRTEISGENPLVSECAVDCSGNCTLYGSNKSGACKACAFQLFRQHRICLPGLRLSVLSGSHPV